MTDSRTAEFGAASETEGMSTRYTEILAEQKKKYRDWVMCPSKYEPEAREPLCMGRRTKSFKAGSIEGTGRFGFSNHTPWEEFQNTIAANKYQKVVAGTAFPKRAEYESDGQWVAALEATEKRLNPKQGMRKTVY